MMVVLGKSKHLTPEISVLVKEGNETVSNCNRLKMSAKDGKIWCYSQKFQG